MNNTQNHTDIVKKGWMIDHIPSAWRPYFYLMRLDRPIGTWLLLLPAWWAILLAGGIAQWPMMILFGIGAVVMRGAGCVVNDLWDRDLDGLVDRTKTRPIPAGDVTPKQALIFLAALLCIGLAILLQFNWLTIVLGMVSTIFVAVYPLMKRITWWPQAFLGLTFNFGALMGWGAVSGDLAWPAAFLYIAGIFWTLGYDTIYALQDRDDDALVGIKSSARYVIERQMNLSVVLAVFYIAHGVMMMVAMAAAMGGGISPWMMAVMMVPFGHLAWQIKTLNPDDPLNALKRFKSNRDYGLAVCVIFGLIYFILQH